MAVVLAVAALAGVGLVLTRTDGTDVDAQDRRAAPDVDLPQLRDPAARLRLPDDGTPVVLNFFASWCVPCKDELPLLREAAAEHGDEVMFLGVDHLDHRDDAVDLLDRFGIDYPTGFDPGGDTAARYRLPGLPATVFIDGDGSIVSVKYGEISAADLDRRIAELLADRTLQRVRR